MRTLLSRFLRGHRRVPVWYDRSYRLPAASIEVTAGIEPRRADFAVWALQRARAIAPEDVRVPARVSYADLERVHTPAYLQSLHEPLTLARIFAIEPSDVVVDALLGAVRLACGGTLAATRDALARGAPALNLLGGFHHAGPARGGGLCALNDIAVAVAVERARGLAGRVCIVDTDAHPPDGLAEAFAGDESVWIGSLSGSDWGPLPGVDETHLPAGCDDREYLAALDSLLARMPRPSLAFVIAGGDVLAGDRMGKLGLSLAGTRRRDTRILAALDGVASVWLPGGGYHPDAWRVLAGTGLVLAGRAQQRIRPGDPLHDSFADIARTLDPGLLTDDTLTAEDLEADLSGRHSERHLLGYYTAEGVEYGLARYGLLQSIERLGYQDLRVVIDHTGIGDRARLFGSAAGREHLLIELVVERRAVAGASALFVHWLTLRHPLVAGRTLLPGQEVPGLGLAREMMELLARMAERLGLAGVAFRPAHFHTAYAARDRLRFADPERQGRFEALVRDLAHLDLPVASRAVAEGRVRLDGAPYTWEADDMVDFATTTPAAAQRVAAARAAARFTVSA